MSTRGGPKHGELDRRRCEDLLRRNHVARIAFTFHDRVDIEPIHYVFADGWVYGRTSAGTKLTTMQHNPWIALEVDEIESAVEWRSVVVHGTAYFLTPESDHPRDAYYAALEHFRSFYPEALSASDPAPFRDIIFRIHADEVSGRYMTTQVE